MCIKWGRSAGPPRAANFRAQRALCESNRLSLRSLPRPLFFALALFALVLGTPPAPSPAQAAPETAATPFPAAELLPADVERALAEVESAADLDEAVRVGAAKLYRQALDQLREADQYLARAAEFDREREEAPALLDAIRRQIEAAQAEELPATELPESLALLESQLLEAEARLARAQEAVAALDAEFQARTDRRIALPALRAGARERLSEAESQLAAPADPAEPRLLAEARQTFLRARLRAIQNEIQACDSELLSYDARGELLPARRDLAALQAAQAEKAVRALREGVNERRRADAEEATRQARAAATRIHPQAGRLAEENEELARLRSGPGGLAARIEEVSRDLDSVDALLAKVTGEFTGVTAKVDAIGLTDAIGYLLRGKRAELPDLGQIRHRNRARQAEIRAVQFRQIQNAERRSELADQGEAEVQALLTSLDPQPPAGKRTEIELTVRSLLKTRLELLEALLRDDDRYFTLLIDLDAKEKSLIEQTRKFEAYIDERILWVPSGEPFGPRALLDTATAIRWMLDPQHWWETGRSVIAAWRPRPWVPVFGAVLLAALFFLRPFLFARVREEGATAARSSTQTIVPTLKATLYTALLAPIRPLGLAWAGWMIAPSAASPEFAQALAAGLQAAALADLMIELVRVLCTENGLGEAHFAWPVRVTRLVHRNLRALTVVGLPLVFVYAGLQAQPEDALQESLGRLALIGIVVIMAVTSHRTLSPSRGVFLEHLQARPEGWARRLQGFWHPAAVTFPAALALIAGLGYTYTAYHLAQRLYGTGWLLLLLLLTHEGGQRWLLLSRRKLLAAQARKKREAAVAELQSQCEQDASPEMPVVLPQVEIDFARLDSQARQLLRVGLGLVLLLGLWWVWVDVLPALGIMRRVELWHVQASTSDFLLPAATAEPVAADGAASGAPAETLIAVTLADVAFALLMLILTAVGTRNIPGLLELVLLQRLNLEGSVRFAVTALSRYLIIVVGTVAACGSIGIGWSKVQWLVAAMTVGLGFGLQEIFANFVSGLIILFERPVRIGDIVTVDDVNGTVTQIRMRATTITDFDRRELIVPNKEFITGKLINWTLTDPVTRAQIAIGVAYGADTARARELLLRAALDCPHVLKDPAPTAVFWGFGASTLDLRLYFFVPRRDLYFPALNEINAAIDASFRAAGIEMAFPQQEIHIEAHAPIPVRILSATEPAPPATGSNRGPELP